MNYVVFQMVSQRMTPLAKKTLAAVSDRHILQRSKLCAAFATKLSSNGQLFWPW